MHAWVNAEVADMIDYARSAREIGSDAIKGYMNVVHQSTSSKRDRSDIVFPLMHATIYSRMTIEAARAPTVKFTSRHEADEPNLKWVEASIKASLAGGPNRPPFDHIYFEQVFDKNLLGVGATYTGFEFTTRLVHVRDDNGKWVERTMVVEDDIRVRNVDFFNFGVSRDMKPGMFDGRACYWDQFYDKSSFFSQFKDNPFYMNINENMIPNGEWFVGAGSGEYAKPTMWKDVYRVRRYWDIVNDVLYEQCNGIPIRWDYILDYGSSKNPKKMLPICTIHNDISFEYDRSDSWSQFATQNNRFYTKSNQVNTNKSFYSKPESLLVKPMIAAQNTFGRAMIDWLKASSIHFVMGPTGVIDRINKGKLYGIETIKLDAGDFTTKSLVQGSTFLQDFKVANDHLQQMSNAAVGRNIFGANQANPAPQATIAAMQREDAQKRDAQNSRYNSTGGLLRMYWLIYILTQQYFVQPRRVKITDLGQIEDVDEHRIMRDADGKPILILDPKKIEIDTPIAEIVSTRKFKIKDPSTGKDIMRMEKRYRLVDPGHSEAIKQGAKSQLFVPGREDYMILREDPRISIIPLSSFQEDSAIIKAASVETMNALVPMMTMAADGKPIIPKDVILFILENFAKAQGQGFDSAKMISLLKGHGKPEDPDDEVVSPPWAGDDMEAPSLQQAMGGAPSPQPDVGSGVPTQTAKMGSPPRPGSALNTNSQLASSLSI